MVNPSADDNNCPMISSVVNALADDNSCSMISPNSLILENRLDSGDKSPSNSFANEVLFLIT